MASLLLHGDLDHPARLTVADLRRRPQHRARVVFDCATNGPQHHVFEGALLRDVIAGAGPVFDARRRKDRSRYLLARTSTARAASWSSRPTAAAPATSAR